MHEEISPFHAELLNAFSEEIDHNFGKIPRLYKREDPLQSVVKREFSYLPSLKRLLEQRSSLSETIPLSAGSKVCLFTYMIGGWGDLITNKEIAKILRNRFPDLTVQSVICIPRHLSLDTCDLDPSTIPILCGQDCPPSLFPEQALAALSASDLVISIPTFYPYTEVLKQLNPRFLCIGQYGFLQSQWFHPESGHLCMGLHPLEMGILTREPPEKPLFSSLENKTLLNLLFGTQTPTPSDIEQYLASHRFYLAYLLNPIGGAVYLHALLQLQIENNQTMDLCTPDIGWLIAYIQMQKKAGRPFLEGNFKIREIQIHFEGRIDLLTLASEGKTVRIICPGALSDRDFRSLMVLSEEMVAVRGDQSFSEALCANRLFFYDPAPWARYFVKDLATLAEEKLAGNTAALRVFRCIAEVSLHHLEEEKGEWVEETFFQTKPPWTQIAAQLASALQGEEGIAGCKKLYEIIRTEHSFNTTLCQLIQKALYHSRKIRT